MEMHGPHDTARRPTPRLTAVGLGCGLVLGVALTAAPASAGARAPEPQLSIAVDNARTSAEAGDTLDYTITVENLGADAVRGLRVTQTLPEGLTLTSADRGGAARPGMVVWSVDLPPSRTQTLHATVTLGATPDQVLRMASVACASVSVKTPPLVCATHSDELPAGREARVRAADEADAASADGAGSSGSGPGVAVLLGLVSGAAVAAAGLVTVLRRRRTRSAAARGPSGAARLTG